jgi:hypothetical protein
LHLVTNVTVVARPAKFSSDGILDTATRLIAGGGPVGAAVTALEMFHHDTSELCAFLTQPGGQRRGWLSTAAATKIASQAKNAWYCAPNHYDNPRRFYG